MAQKTITPNCVQSYITTIARLSQKLLEVVINLQDERVHCVYCVNRKALYTTLMNSTFFIPPSS